MKIGFNTLARDSLFYFTLNLTPKLLSFIMVPLLTRIFVPSEYGIIETIGAFTSVVTSFLILGMSTAIFRFYPEYEGNEKRELISTAFWFREIFSIAIIVPMIIISPFLSDMLFKTEKYYYLLTIGFLAIPFALATDTGIDVSRLNFKRFNYGAISLCRSIGGFLLTLLIVVWLRLGIVGLLWAGTLGTIIASLVASFSIRNNLGFIFCKKKLSILLKFGLPLVFTIVGLWVSNSSDRFFLARISGLSETGLYAIGYKLASVIGLIVTAFQLAFSPIAYTNYKEPDAPEFFKVFFDTYSILIFSAGMLLTLFSIEILHLLVPDNFYGGHKVVGLIVLSVILNGIIYFVSMGISFAKKTKYMAYIYLSGATVNILFNTLLIPKYGMMGAAVATLASFFIMALMGNYWGKIFFPTISFPFYKIVIVVLLFLLLYIVNIFNPPSFLTRLILFLSFLLVLVLIFKIELLAYKKFKRIAARLFQES